MTDERLFELLAAHAGPADVAPGFEDRLYALLLQEPRRSGRPARPALLLVAALLATLAISAAVAVGSGVVELTWLDASPTPSAAESDAPTPGSPQPSASMLPNLSLPGMGLNEPAGEYGWTGVLGQTGGMHRVVEDGRDGRDFRQTQLIFSVLDECFAPSSGDPVTVAGLDGLYVEPYEPPRTFIGPRGGETTGAYALPIGDRTLCVYLTWDPATTPDELEAGRQVVESIRGQPFGPNGIRINFTLPAGWDTG
jgi:hypothetical protein